MSSSLDSLAYSHTRISLCLPQQFTDPFQRQPALKTFRMRLEGSPDPEFKADRSVLLMHEDLLDQHPQLGFSKDAIGKAEAQLAVSSRIYRYWRLRWEKAPGTELILSELDFWVHARECDV